MSPPAALRLGSLCTGYGGLDVAVQDVFGGALEWVADNDPGASRILAHRHPSTPNLGDITAIDWRAVEPVDVLLGGYPCQPFSTAGRRKGTADARHIWPHIANALRTLRPRIAIFENVANHLRLGFADVLADLARLGFDAEWCLVRASEVGAPHQRNRLFLYATAADAPHLGHERGRGTRDGRPGPTDSRGSSAYAQRLVPGDDSELPAGWDTVRDRVRDDAPRCGAPAAADADGLGRGEGEHGVRAGQPDAAWGRFLPAIRRWEAVTGHHAPRATDDRHRLSPPFVEWLMGLAPGYVTDVPGLTRTQQLKALGNGVVPQQAVQALRYLARTTRSADHCVDAA
ncbi:DNA cytosine methyltransferase [Streptomyces sp. NBC_01003]|uniref:DNA cytosine methyltransferase n=1 Tax=Streptomyces sp. NBC_01003 TaxID=2903714 RepID=UPI003869AAE0|nr:DNA cytosine methyltransferase [Streptomyces sp. NBC_01003]